MKNATISSPYNFQVVSAWALTLLVSLLAVIAWGDTYNWQLGALTAYQFFPLLGLIAFSIMWTHYVIGFVQTYLWKSAPLARFFRLSGYVVLVSILLHPGIFLYERFRDGYGLPPGSYKTYLGPSMAWIIMLGAVSLFVFLAYELHRWFDKKSWWKYVLYAGDAAMVAILYHGLRIGGQLMHGWYRGVWFTYGAILIFILAYSYMRRFLEKNQPA